MRLYSLILFCRKLQNYVYSYIIKGSFDRAGKKFRIEYPILVSEGENISVGDNFSARSRLRIEAISKHNEVVFYPKIIIGNNVALNYDCHIGCVNKIEIHDNVLIASRVFITDHFHGKIDLDTLLVPPNERIVYSKGPVIIQENVWIGEGVAIMPNVIIGKNSVVGANSVVTKSFPENSVIAGVPAKLIKKIE